MNDSIAEHLLTPAAGNYDVNKKALSSKAQLLIQDAFDGIPPSAYRDHHVHIAGIGAGGTDYYLHQEMFQWWHPFMQLKYEILANASGMRDKNKADQQYIERLAPLAHKFPSPENFTFLLWPSTSIKKDTQKRVKPRCMSPISTFYN